MNKLISIILLSSLTLFARESIEIFEGKHKREIPASSKSILSYSKILKNAKSSVVNISTQKSVAKGGVNHRNPFFNDPFFRQFFDRYNYSVPKERIQKSLGSGVIVTKDGYIVTNNHVIEGSDKVIVNIEGSKKDFEAAVIGTDPKSDLAVIKIEGEGFDAVKFYNSDDIEVGDVVFAIGNPFGVGETITSGIVSAKNRNSVGINEYEDFIQTDAPINPGNSGGALVNSLGLLVGINSAILTKSGGNNGVGFSIPSNMVATVANSLIEKGSYERAWLGVSIGVLTSDLAEYYDKDYGVVLTSIKKDSPAEEGGLKRGDLILKAGGKKIDSPSKLKNIISSKSPGTTISIEYLRGKEKKRGDIKLGSLDRGELGNGEYLYKGMKLNNLTDGLKRNNRFLNDIEGVYVFSVEESSEAYAGGVRKGDIIVQVESMEISTLTNFKSSVAQSGKKRFFIYRNGNIFVTIF